MTSFGLTLGNSLLLFVQVSASLRILNLGIEMNGGCDEVDVLLDVFRKAVFFTCNVGLSGESMLELVIFGVQEFFSFASSNTSVDPVEALRLLDSAS